MTITIEKVRTTLLENYWLQREQFKREIHYLTLSHSTDELSEKDRVRLVSMKRAVDVMDSIYNSVDDSYKTIIDMRFNPDDVAEWIEIADELNCSTQKVLRKRTRLMEMTAAKVGIL